MSGRKSEEKDLTLEDAQKTYDRKMHRPAETSDKFEKAESDTQGIHSYADKHERDGTEPDGYGSNSDRQNDSAIRSSYGDRMPEEKKESNSSQRFSPDAGSKTEERSADADYGFHNSYESDGYSYNGSKAGYRSDTDDSSLTMEDAQKTYDINMHRQMGMSEGGTDVSKPIEEIRKSQDDHAEKSDKGPLASGIRSSYGDRTPEKDESSQNNQHTSSNSGHMNAESPFNTGYSFRNNMLHKEKVHTESSKHNIPEQEVTPGPSCESDDYAGSINESGYISNQNGSDLTMEDAQKTYDINMHRQAGMPEDGPAAESFIRYGNTQKESVETDNNAHRISGIRGSYSKEKYEKTRTAGDTPKPYKPFKSNAHSSSANGKAGRTEGPLDDYNDAPDKASRPEPGDGWTNEAENAESSPGGKVRFINTIKNGKTRRLDRTGHKIYRIVEQGFEKSLRDSGSYAAIGVDTSRDVKDFAIEPLAVECARAVKAAAYLNYKTALREQYGFDGDLKHEIKRAIHDINTFGYGEIRGNPQEMLRAIRKIKRKNKAFLTEAEKALLKKTEEMLTCMNLEKPRRFKSLRRAWTKFMGQLRKTDAGIGMSIVLQFYSALLDTFRRLYGLLRAMYHGGTAVKEWRMEALQKKIAELQKKIADAGGIGNLENPITDLKKLTKAQKKEQKLEKKINKRKQPGKIKSWFNNAKEKLFSPINSIKSKIWNKFKKSRLVNNKVGHAIGKVLGFFGKALGKIVMVAGAILHTLFVLLAIFAAIFAIAIIIVCILEWIVAAHDVNSADPDIKNAVVQEIDKLYSEQQETIRDASSSYRYVNVSYKDMKDDDVYELHPPQTDFYETTNTAEILTMTLNRFDMDLESAGKKRVVEYVDKLFRSSHQVSITEYPYYDVDDEGNEVLMYVDADIEVTTYYFPYIYNCDVEGGNWVYGGSSLDSGMKYLAKTTGVVQGMCVAGNYIIQAQNYGEPMARVSIFDISSGRKVNEQFLKLGHANSLTYNPNTKEVVCAEDGYIHIMSFNESEKTLKIKKNIKLKGTGRGSYGIAYVASQNCYYLRGGSYIYRTFDFKTIGKAFKYKKTIRGQGLASDGTNLYIMGGADYAGVIYNYTIKGNCVGTYRVSKIKELEEIDFSGSKMYIAGIGGSAKSGVYYVNGQNTTSSVIGGGTAVGNSVAEKIWNYFRGAGFSEQAAAAICGNAMRESSMQPGIISKSGTYYGLWQMSKTYFKLKETADLQNKDWKDVQYQCDFLLNKLKKDYKTLKWSSKFYKYRYNGKTSCSLSEFVNMTNIEDATAIFYCAFENSLDDAEIAKRLKFANQFYKKFTGKSVAGGSSSQISAESDTVNYWVGDGRIAGLQAACGSMITVSDAKGDYAWYRTKGDSLIRERLKKKPNATVVYNIGLSDCKSGASRYVKLIKKVMKDYPDAKIYVMSLNPVDESKTTTVKNSDIEAFNKTLKSSFKGKYLDCYSYLKKNGYITDELGMYYSTVTYKMIYSWTIQKVSK